MQATYFTPLSQNKVRCELCPHFCILAEGEVGPCLVRYNEAGTLHTSNEGHFTAMAVEPIEKKPLWHFFPGGRVLSVGSTGCTLSCTYCQNWPVSQTKQTPTTYFSPEALIAQAQKNRVQAICFTYNEPFLMFEYLKKCLPLLQKASIPLVIKTGGYLNLEPLKELLPYIHAINLDLKGDDAFYQKICAGHLSPVLEAALLFKQYGIHLEISHLIVPEENDQEQAYHTLASWIQTTLGQKTPVHLGLFFPAHRAKHLKTPSFELLEQAYHLFLSYLPFTYLAFSASMAKIQESFCPTCGTCLITRNAKFEVQSLALTLAGHCAYCQEVLPFVLFSSENLEPCYASKTY